MKLFTKLILTSTLIAGTACAVTTPANAGVGISIGIGIPGDWDGYYYADKPCWWYARYDFPAPRHCYRYYYSLWRDNVYWDGDFIFRDRDDWWRWHDRDEYH